MALTKTVNGKAYEALRFPMKYMKITQGANGPYSHKGCYALDLAGVDAGIDPTYAPCKMKLVQSWNSDYGNPVWFQSVEPVLFADGTVDYASFLFLHDNYTGDITAAANIGHIWQQWEEFGDEGTAGNATGNHCHMEVAKGKVKGYVKNSYNVWMLPDAISPDKAFVVDGVTLCNDGDPISSGNKMLWHYSKDIPGAAASSSAATTSSKSDGYTWNYDAALKAGDVVSSCPCRIAEYAGSGSCISSDCVNIPYLGGLVPLADVTEAKGTGDGACDGVLSNDAALVYLDPCTVTAIDTKNNLVQVKGAGSGAIYWVKPDGLCRRE